MSRLTIFQLALMNLNQEISPERREYSTQEYALDFLKSRTDQDFGYDAEKWRIWLKENKPEVSL